MPMHSPSPLRALACASACVPLLAGAAPSATPMAGAAAAQTGSSPTNILFIILDDVGGDQLSITNPSNPALARTPTIEAVASQGVNFTNCWAMPECSPSRVSFFTGRFPARTGVGSPLTQTTLAQSQCSPFEVTAPRLLAQAGYASALFGKFHLAQNEENPYGLGAPASVGFTHFNGTLLGGPPFIDETVFGQITEPGAVASCGYPVAGNAPAICACAFEDEPCEEGIDAVDCLTAGGVPLTGSPIPTCDADAIARINWSKTSGNYAWPRTVNQGGAAFQEIPARVYADTDQAELATAFILEHRAAGTPWMCSLSFTGDHDPWQQPPAELLPPGTQWPQDLPYACDVEPGIDSAGLQQRLLSDWTIESMDRQIRRVLLSTGLASIGPKGLTINAPDTLIVIIGDNGSFLTTVKAPFNPVRAKATAYQTGIVVPLVISGGPVVAPGRAVDAMVNVVDLFELWGEAAGLDVREAMPGTRQLDSFPMMPYLRNPVQEPLRQFNYSEYREPYQAEPCYPCLFTLPGEATCTDSILTTQQLCESQGGVWYGPGGVVTGAPQDTCCELFQALDEPAGFAVVYSTQQAITDGRYKLIANTLESCSVPIPGTAAYEFYDLSQCPFATELFGRGIDNPGANLLTSGTPLSPEQSAALDSLSAELDALNTDMAPCLGDVNLNGVVGGADLGAMLSFWGGPSVADLNNDALTDGADLEILIGAWGPCGPD
jgi:arylsulfatase A-like enzyme